MSYVGSVSVASHSAHVFRIRDSVCPVWCRPTGSAWLRLVSKRAFGCSAACHFR